MRNGPLCRSLNGVRQWHIFQELQRLHAGLNVSTGRYHSPSKISRSFNLIKAFKLDHQARPGKSALVERTDSRVSRFSNARAKFQAAQAFQKETGLVHCVSPRPEIVTHPMPQVQRASTQEVSISRAKN